MHGQPIELGHRARVHGESVKRVPREDRQQAVELLPLEKPRRLLTVNLTCTASRNAPRMASMRCGSRAVPHPHTSCRRWARDIPG